MLVYFSIFISVNVRVPFSIPLQAFWEFDVWIRWTQNIVHQDASVAVVFTKEGSVVRFDLQQIEVTVAWNPSDDVVDSFSLLQWTERQSFVVIHCVSGTNDKIG